MFGKNSEPALALGAIYQEIGRQGCVWELVDYLERPGLPVHVRLRNCTSHRHMTIAAAILANASRYRRLPPSPRTGQV